MKNIMLIFCLSGIASAEVLVKQSVNENPATGVRIVTVLLTVKGDKPYSGDPSAPPAELGIMCQQMSVGKHQQSKVALTLGTGVIAETGFPIPDSGLLQSLGIILTLIRFDDETHPRQLAWEQTAEYPGLLIREDFKFIRDHIFNSKLAYIEVTESGAGTYVSSFNLSGIKQEFAKHRECKQ
jgi:hypothetical protein